MVYILSEWLIIILTLFDVHTPTEASGEASGEGSGNDTGSVISLYYAYRRYGSSRDMDNVEYHCSGSENSLSECTQRAQNSRYYRCSSSAGIYCYSFPAKPECSDDDVRLVGGSGPHEGRLEVCYNGKWSSVCSISTNQAGIVCERLGYTSASKEYDIEVLTFL